MTRPFDRATFSLESGRTKHPPSAAALLEIPGTAFAKTETRAGGFGDIWKATWNGKAVAVKRILRKGQMNDEQSEDTVDKMLLKEQSILLRLKHDHILSVEGMCRFPLGPEEICLVLPFVEDFCTLLDFLRVHHEPAPHTLKNVLVQQDGNNGPWKALICDFGLSKVVPVGFEASLSSTTDRAGVVLAPELLVGAGETRRDRPTDVFAFGYLIYKAYTIACMPPQTTGMESTAQAGGEVQVLSERRPAGPPARASWTDTAAVLPVWIYQWLTIGSERPNINDWEKMRPIGQKVKILLGVRPRRPPQADLTTAMWELVERCWHQDPNMRPTMIEVVAELPRCAPGAPTA
ncbi:kinase-like protein [Auricularia subglabra TFB-10046 SS5]|nr:kinase-like protein [Auricularia subglabra TFB-10046 SS5]